MKDKLLGSFFSSTMWFGFLLMLANYLTNNVEMFQGWVPKQYDDLVLYGVGIVVWLLRWVTTKPVEKKLPKHKNDLSELEKAIIRDSDEGMY